MAVSQRGVALSGLVTPSGVLAWKTVSSWYLVAADHQTIPPAAEQIMAERMNVHTTEIASSHVAMISNPKVVVDLILAAAQQASPAG